VLNAWKEREPGFIRRRQRITEIEGAVPAFADDVEMAKLGSDEDTEIEVAAPAEQAEAQPQSGAVATAERPSDGNGSDPAADDGEPDAASERRQRNAERRARRQQRRKHGRNR